MVANKLLKFDEATSYLIEILYHTRQENTYNEYEHAARLFQLANILYNKESYLESKDFLNEVIRILQTYSPTEDLEIYKSLFLLFHAQKLLANNYIQIHFYDSANVPINRAFSLIDSILTLDPESRQYIEMFKTDLQYIYAKYYLQKENYKKADSLLYLINSNYSNSNYYQKIRFRSGVLLALSYLKQNKREKAQKIIDSIEIYSYNYKDKLSAEFYDIKSQICAKLNDYECAYKSKLLSKSIIDSISSVILLSNKINATREYLNLLNVISQEKYLKKIQKDKFKIIFISLFSVILLIMLYMLYRQIKKNKILLNHERFLSSELKKKNSELTETINQLKDSQQYNKFLIKHLAHDLRNPLLSIKGLAEIASADAKSEVIREYLELIEKQTSISLDYINYLLNSSKGITKKELQCINIIADKSIQANSLMALQKNILLKREYENTCYCYVDFYKIWSLFNNLLNNAIKFSKRGSVVKISISLTGSEVTIKVTDSGIGIPSTDIEKILSDEMPKGRPGTDGEISYGIGLKLCKQIVMEHDGRFYIFSEEGKGSTFVIILPCGFSNKIEKSSSPTETLETS
ncbi:hypothetical protein JCM31826_12760 [Thermaurantimonas aggregans]|uniref:histidine kinase n=2 Tax=Thermaurantimonas aggregans TaxID=2173829 RepID=A0A401XLD2_9FLAO|nr:hypothetical protein JCM31826_12760 [Thermaurantimonas aggregans]